MALPPEASDRSKAQLPAPPAAGVDDTASRLCATVSAGAAYGCVEWFDYAGHPLDDADTGCAVVSASAPPPAATIPDRGSATG